MKEIIHWGLKEQEKCLRDVLGINRTIYAINNLS